MPNKPISNEQLAELDRLHEAAIKGMNWQEVAQFQAMIAEQYQPLRQRLLAAESRLADAGRERDQLRALADAARDGMRQLGEDLEASRAEVERLRSRGDDFRTAMVENALECDAATARAEAAEGRAAGLYRALCDTVKASGGIAREGLSDEFLILGVPAEMAARKKAQEAAEALVAGLREALEEAGDVVHACFCETEEIRGKVCHPSCIAINTALTITPASAANRTDEETEAANER